MGIVGGRRRTVGRMVMAACVGSLLLGAAGCTAPSTPTPTSNPPTVAPIFASDEEALAAATAAYEGYVHVADQIVRDGGKDPSRIREYVSEELALSEIDSFASLSSQGFHGVGESTYFNFSVQRVSQGDPPGKNLVTAYLCSDLSNTDVVDEAGDSVVTPSRQEQTPFEVTFDKAKSDSNALVVSRVTVWSGDGVCP